jgi:hypothetical protein
MQNGEGLGCLWLRFARTQVARRCGEPVTMT